MSNKNRMEWGKVWADSYLADLKIEKLSPGAESVINRLWAILRTQTDEPGAFIINGKALNIEEIGALVKQTKRYGPATRRVMGWVWECHGAALIVQRSDGVYVSKRIVREYEESRLQGKRGKAGATNRYGTRHNQMTEDRGHARARARDYSGNDEAEYPVGTPIDEL